MQSEAHKSTTRNSWRTGEGAKHYPPWSTSARRVSVRVVPELAERVSLNRNDGGALDLATAEGVARVEAGRQRTQRDWERLTLMRRLIEKGKFFWRPNSCSLTLSCVVMLAHDLRWLAP